MTGITLVLGGGGFKGLSHLGVLKVLQDQGIPVARVVGASAGALMGASYCYLSDADAAHDLVMGFMNSEAFRDKASFPRLRSRTDPDANQSWMARILTGIKRQFALERMFRRSSAFGAAPLRFIARALLPKLDIAELTVPLAVCALDLVRGEEVLLTEGNLLTAVVASSSVPGFFPPVERGGTLVCDPGIVNNLPTRLARGLGAQRLVAVDLSAGIGPCADSIAEMIGMDVLLRAQDISTRIANRQRADQADVVIVPELQGRSWLDPSDPEKIVAAGVVATHHALPQIQALLNGTARRARAG